MSTLVGDRGAEAQAREGRGAADPRSPADALLRSLRAFLIAKARAAPVLLVFEDLHWAEESLLDLLRLLVQRGGEAPILVLCLARPELQQRHPDWGAGLRNYTAVALAPLSADFSRRLMMELLKDEATLAEVRDAILSRAEGNPFYLQEILRMLIDGGGLVRDKGGWRWASPPPEIRIPDTIHGILASRLDLLSPLEKRAIQDAAVAGRVFWLGALIATSGLTAAEATAALARLQERDLIEERLASSVAGEREFAFTHALIREVAYATVPKAARSDKHERFATWLERTVGQTSDEFVEFVAIHREHAWRYRFETGDRAPELARAAVAVLRRAAERARALRTFPEARRLSERALAVMQNAGLDDDHETLLEVLIDRTEAVKWLSSPAIVEKDTQVVLERAAALGREDLLARAWLNRAFAEYDRGRLQAAEDALRRALDLFERLHDRRGQAEAFEILGAITEDLRGKISTAQTAYSHALELYRQMGDSQGVARCMAWYGRAVMDAGNLTGARQWLIDANEFAKAHHERISQAYSANALGLLAHMQGDSPEAVRRFQEAIAIRQELGDRMTEANVRRHLAMHHLRWGRLDEAERELQAARALRREHGVKAEGPLVLRGLAEVALARGDLLAAADLAEQAYAAISEHNEPISKGTHAATLARVRAAQGRRQESEDLFRQSLELLEGREYRFDLALTLLKYGESLRLLGDQPRARQVLERARAMFSEMGATHFVGVADLRLATGASIGV
jgi:tetratricopeptide (TPR) repeat protein